MLVRIRTKGPPLKVEDHHQHGADRTLDVDVDALERVLRRNIQGEVRFSAGDRALYGSDASNYRQIPLGVVLPRDITDVIASVEACREHGAPIMARGGGTGIPGQSVNVAVVIDFSKYMNRVTSLDPRRQLATVEPGCILDTLRDGAEAHGLTFGPDPATHDRNTLGGMVGNNSCGIHSVATGRTSDNIESLDVLTYDGVRLTVGKTDDEMLPRLLAGNGRSAQIYRELDALRTEHAELIRRRFPKLPRRVSGYNLPELLPENGFNVGRALVGSECTCVLVLGITCKLVHSSPARVLVVLGFPDVFVLGDYVPRALTYGMQGLEGIDHEFMEDVRKKGMRMKGLDNLPKGRAWLLAEFGGETKPEAEAKARAFAEAARGESGASGAKVVVDRGEMRAIWQVREAGLGATSRVPGEPDNHEGWEDSAVPPEELGAYLRDFRQLLDEYGYSGPLYGHFGDGCVHTRLTFDLETPEGVRKWRSFLDRASDLVVARHGSFSGEHGDGQARGELLPKMFGDEMMAVFRRFKTIWDPDWKMNPGKLVAPYEVDANLRWTLDYEKLNPETHFKYPGDKRNFAYATERCVGAGVCRRLGGGTMCPSYMVTLEEKHSTRGRARLLSEMIRGEPVKGGWRSEEVKEALDLCLACKGCKGECPVQVDLATYKAEFLAHYYRRRLRPIVAWTMGRIQFWARLASLVPRLVNFVTQNRWLGPIAKAIAGIDQRRKIPAFARRTFRHWFSKRESRNAGRRVLLWPDTFNNYFHPDTARSAVEVLEAANFKVEIPATRLCCGRPLYDFGLLGRAKAHLRTILDALSDAIAEGVPVVVLEPSCASVFRDELINLFPDDDRARRLSRQTFLLSEFLVKHAPDFQPLLQRRALLHGHCHQKALVGMDDEEALLKRMGVDVQTPETGCCGMAGAFGFERGEHYDVAEKCGERVLLPAVRQADPSTIVVADGFSCREQIAQSTKRRAMHMADVLRLALRHEARETK